MQTQDKNRKPFLWFFAYILYFFCMWLYWNWTTRGWDSGQGIVGLVAFIGLFVAGFVAFAISGALSDSKEDRMWLFHIVFMVSYLTFNALFL
jgi:hypothetical protein